MKPSEFIHKNIVQALKNDGFPSDVALRAADKGVEHYHRCSQASKRGAMFDDCLYRARLEATYQTPKSERKKKPARSVKSKGDKLL